MDSITLSTTTHHFARAPPSATVFAPFVSPRSVAMDLLAQEIARKRKAKAEEFGGAKYARKSQINAVREAKLRAEEEEERRARLGAHAEAETTAVGGTTAPASDGTQTRATDTAAREVRTPPREIEP